MKLPMHPNVEGVCTKNERNEKKWNSIEVDGRTYKYIAGMDQMTQTRTRCR